MSGATDPFDTPQLGDWLHNRAPEFDILCAWKLDRISRRAIPMNKLFGWLIDHDKTLVCTADNLDLSTWIGRMIANVIAGCGRGGVGGDSGTSTQFRKLRETARWAGGKPPFGYTAERHDDGPGWSLKID